jgi:hypothetical protein
MKRKLLTVGNKGKIESFLKDYLSEVLEEEEYINSFSEALKEAERVEVYGNNKFITPHLISEWLRGLPIGTEYRTYNIICMLLNAVTGKADYNQLKEYKEDDYELDCYYWETLGLIIYREGMKEE